MASRTAAVTRAQLRGYAVARSLFAPLDLLGAIERLGFVQIDPIRSPARAQDLILRHRVVDYRVGDLDRAYSSLPVAEDHLHVYGVMPRTVQRLLHPRATAHVWRVESEHPALADAIVAHVRRHGPTHPAMLQKALGSIGTVNAWGGRSNASTRMLEALHHRGMLRVRHRENGIKVYELAAGRERALSAATRARGVLSLLLRLYAPLPIVTLARLARMVGNSVLSDDVREDQLRRFLRSTAVRRVAVDGLDYVWPAGESLEAQPPDAVRLFAPFDPVVWDRRRFEHLWGWAYRFEAYTPAAKRRIGYYALPLLWRDAVIGWANVRMQPTTTSRVEPSTPSRTEPGAKGTAELSTKARTKPGGDLRPGPRSVPLDVDLGFVERRPASRAFTRALDAEIARLEIALRARKPGAVPIAATVST